MHNIVFADSSVVYSGILIAGQVLSLVCAQKKQDNRLQHHTPTMYAGLIKCASISARSVILGFKHLHLPWDLVNVNAGKT